MAEPQMVLEPGKQKKRYVRNMFNAIAHRYDFLNHFLSFGIDILWRKKAVRKLQVSEEHRVLDLACGTADFALEAIRQKGCHVVGVDIALRMLKFALPKIADEKIHSRLAMINADGENLPFKEHSFHGMTIAFGIRNMGDMQRALKEINRVLTLDGQAIILEFSLPTFFLFRQLYLFYFKNILPLIGRLVSKDPAAYSYLPASVEKFPSIGEFTAQLKMAGFDRVEYWKLLNGVAVIYRATKIIP
ncbi:bifunctional demethylmenaquinone methyltransferase/2-methoxy-6-polyprenyl-1,4-benzoquinol methylase UbiE [Calditrichota bacterium LG25]